MMDIEEQVTELLPVPTMITPAVSPPMQQQYDMRLATILATMLGITPEQLVKDTQEASCQTL